MFSPMGRAETTSPLSGWVNSLFRIVGSITRRSPWIILMWLQTRRRIETPGPARGVSAGNPS
jgi:hypothetical protein